MYRIIVLYCNSCLIRFLAVCWFNNFHIKKKNIYFFVICSSIYLCCKMLIVTVELMLMFTQLHNTDPAFLSAWGPEWGSSGSPLWRTPGAPRWSPPGWTGSSGMYTWTDRRRWGGPPGSGMGSAHKGQTQREREREGWGWGVGWWCSLGWNGSLPFMNIQSPPVFHWCLTDVSLRVGKWVALETVLPQSCFYCCKKMGMYTVVHPQILKRGCLELVIKYRWAKCSWSHVAPLKLGHHLGHMFRSVTLHWGIL